MSNCNGADRAVEEFRSLLAIPLTLFIDLKVGKNYIKRLCSADRRLTDETTATFFQFKSMTHTQEKDK